jgi:hypothetical protein
MRRFSAWAAWSLDGVLFLGGAPHALLAVYGLAVGAAVGAAAPALRERRWACSPVCCPRSPTTRWRARC